MISIAGLLLVATATNVGEPSGCECPQSIGADAGATPLAVAYDAEKRARLVACGGGGEERGSGGRVTASEFEVFRCGADTAILTFTALQTCVVEPGPNTLKITELRRWPFGRNWAWVDVPYLEYTVSAEPAEAIRKVVVLDPPKLTSVQVQGALREYAELKQAPAWSELTQEQKLARLDAIEALIGKMLAAALLGNADGRRSLRHMNNELGFSPGHLDEMQAEAIEIYDAYAEATGKVPRLGAARTPLE